MRDIIQMPKSKFLVVACKKCKNSQVIFSKAATKVHCTNCKEEIAVPTGGTVEVKGKVVQQL